MSPAAEWLLDNFHIVSAAARDIQHDLPPSYFRRLPRIVSDEFAGLPRIYALALELIGSSAGRLDAQRLQRFISAFQSVTPLTMGELWAWPSVLKLALLDHLRARGEVLAATRVHRLAADSMAAAIEALADRAITNGRRTIHHAFVTRLLQRVACARPDGVATASPARGCARAARRDHRGCDPRRGAARGAEQATVANLITSLRLIGTFDWSEFFESVSLVEQVLQRDPAGRLRPDGLPQPRPLSPRRRRAGGADRRRATAARAARASNARGRRTSARPTRAPRTSAIT